MKNLLNLLIEKVRVKSRGNKMLFEAMVCVIRYVDRQWERYPDEIGRLELSTYFLTGANSPDGFNEFEAPTITEALALLSGSFGLLNLQFEYEDDNGEVHEIYQEDIDDAIEGNESLPHPITGDPIPDWENKVYLYYTVNVDFRNELVTIDPINLI